MGSNTPQVVRLNPRDDVVVALMDLEPEMEINGEGATCAGLVPEGHKMAVRNVPAGQAVRKYGQIIGFASSNILAGDHVHSHNLEMGSFTRDYAIGVDAKPTFILPSEKQATFEGIVRPDGKVATRNYLGVLATVSCSSGVAHLIADALDKQELASYPNIDGIVALGHGTGCGMDSEGEDMDRLQKVIGGYARHPNFAGILVVGLGCEKNQINSLCHRVDLEPGPFLHTMNIQDLGGTRETVNRGSAVLREMLPAADQIRRQTLSISNLILGLECGGSDAYSGISANPALGAAVDLLVHHGGTAVLSETTEIYGAEHLLTRRASSPQVAEKLLERIKWWENYTAMFGTTVNNNPTPGNKTGGLSTILEKSLGAVAKGGSTNLNQIYQFGEPVDEKGLVFMDTPGYDMVSITGMIAGGATMVCFTTGRGSVSGFKPVPCLKLASNTLMYSRLKGDMDINCGLVVDGEATIEQTGQIIFQNILDTASGRKSKSEAFGFGESEFVPWHLGVVT